MHNTRRPVQVLDLRIWFERRENLQIPYLWLNWKMFSVFVFVFGGGGGEGEHIILTKVFFFPKENHHNIFPKIIVPEHCNTASKHKETMNLCIFGCNILGENMQIFLQKLQLYSVLNPLGFEMQTFSEKGPNYSFPFLLCLDTQNMSEGQGK